MPDDATKLLRVADQMADLINELTLAGLAAHGAMEISGSLLPEDLRALVVQIERAQDLALDLKGRIEQIRQGRA